MSRQLFDVLLRESADHDRVEVTRKHRRRVLERLASAELEVAGREVEAGAAELGDPDFEGDPRAGRGFLEDHPQRSAREEVMLFASFLLLLELVSELEDTLQFVARPVGDSCEVTAFQIL